MLVINYNGNKPTTDYFKFSVQGNNKADTIRFLVSLNQSGLVFDENYHYYAKVQSVDDDYYDKVELSEVEFDDSRNLLKADFILKAQQTSHKQIEVSLSCENLDSEVVWQTQLVKVAIANGVNADEEIADQYPSVLQDLQAQIDELKQQGGGGGSTEVEIKRVYLTYDRQFTNIMKYIAKDGVNNEARDVWFNFETTPINARMEEEITNGRFVIRLDYPIGSKIKANFDGNGHARTDKSTKGKTAYGMGTRGFTPSFSMSESNPNQLNNSKRQILLNSLIFITPQDIKTNRYGEKYIHKKVSFFDYVNRICSFDQNSLRHLDSGMFFPDYEGQQCLGIPAPPYQTDHNDYGGLSRAKVYLTGGFPKFSGSETDFINASKLNPAFTTYCPLQLYGTQFDEITLFSPYFIGIHKGKTFQQINGDFVMVRNEEYVGHHRNRGAYMSARPRCAILNDDYENSEYAFLRTYPQADQQIKLMCKIMLNYQYDVDDIAVPIFRTIITQK